MATIASLAVQLVLDDKKFESAMKRSVAVMAGGMNRIRQIGGQGNAVLASMANSVAGGDVFGAMRTGVQATTGAVQSLVGAIPYIGPAVSAAVGIAGSALDMLIGWVERAIGWFRQGAAHINDLRVSAARLGISIEDMSIIAMAGGGDVEGMARGMSHLTEKIIEAAMKAPATETAFRSIGLSARSLAAMKGGDALRAVIGALHNIGPGMMRTAKVSEMFGERVAQNFMQLVSKGVPALDALKDSIKRFGQDVNGVDAEKVRQATVAMGGIGKAVEGAQMQIAIGLSPLVVALGEQFADAGVSADAMREIAVKGAKMIAMGAAYVVESWAAVKIAFKAVMTGVLYVAHSMMRALQSTLKYAGELPDSMGGQKFRDAAQTVKFMVDDLGGEIKDLADSGRDDWDNFGSSVEKVEGFFDALDKKTREAKTKMAKTAAEGAGGTATGLFEALKKKALEMENDTRTPLENLANKIEEINFMAEQGALSWDTYARAIAKATGELGAPSQPKLAGAASFGSQEAYATINNKQLTDMRADPVLRLYDLIKANQAKEARQREDVAAIAAAVRAGLFKAV